MLYRVVWGFVSLVVFCGLTTLFEHVMLGTIGENTPFWIGGYTYLAFMYGYKDPPRR